MGAPSNRRDSLAPKTRVLWIDRASLTAFASSHSLFSSPFQPLKVFGHLLMIETTSVELEKSGPFGALELGMIEDVRRIQQATQATCEADAFVLDRL